MNTAPATLYVICLASLGCVVRSHIDMRREDNR